jgi:hypothetical protein
LSVRALLVAALLVLALVLAPLASSSPDGLERVAAEQGFADKATPARASPISDYALPGVDDPWLTGALAGLAGTAAVFTAGCATARLLRRRRA